MDTYGVQTETNNDNMFMVNCSSMPRLKHFFYPSSDRVASVPLGRLPPWVLRTAPHSLRRTATAAPHSA